MAGRKAERPPLGRGKNSLSVHDAPILGLLRDTLGYLTQRQKVLSENVANANTPGYVPRDIANSDFAQAVERNLSRMDGASRMTVTSSRHIGTPGSASGLTLRPEDNPDSEITIDGNAVVLEEQMGRVIDTQMRYETVVGLYQKSLGLIRLAARGPMR